MPADLLAWARMPTEGQNAKGQNTTEPKKLGSIEKKNSIKLALAIAIHRHRPHPSTHHRRCQKHQQRRVKFLDPTAGEQRGRQTAWNGALQNIPDRVQRCTRCGQEGHNVVRCPAIPAGF